MLSLKLISEMYDMEVYTESGNFFGVVEEVILTSSKVEKWQFLSAKKSILKKLVGSAKGVTVPHNLVMAIKDIMIIKYEYSSDEKD